MSFYRIRRADSLPTSIDEFFALPPDRAKKGRCSFDGLPMLYLSEDGMTPFEELGVQLHEKVYMAKYNIKSGEELDLRYPFPQRPDSIPTTGSEKRLLAERIMREFVRSEFMKPVGIGTEFLYNATASICWFMRRHMHGRADGISYPSIIYGNHRNNVALYPDSQEKLEIVDVRVVELVSEGEHSGRRDVGSHFHPVFDTIRQVVSGGRLLTSHLKRNPRFVNCCSKGRINGQVISWEPCLELGEF